MKVSLFPVFHLQTEYSISVDMLLRANKSRLDTYHQPYVKIEVLYERKPQTRIFIDTKILIVLIVIIRSLLYSEILCTRM